MIDPRIAMIEKKFLKTDESLSEFRPGDTVKVHVKVKEGNRERIQIFEGVVIGPARRDPRELYRKKDVRQYRRGKNIPRPLPEREKVECT